VAWAIVSGEYPPQVGGVADYTAQLAAALAAAGDAVEVWAPARAGAEAMARAAGVTLHALPDHFGWRSRRLLTRALGHRSPAPRLLIQYVPHAYGHKGMNWRFARCVWRQRHLRPWVMFHEVAFATTPGLRLRHRLLARVTQKMAQWLYRASERAFVATPAWGTWLQALAPGGAVPAWLPVPSNLPLPTPEAVAAARAEWNEASAVIGSFCGGVAGYSRDCLQRVIPALLNADARRRVFLAGGEGLRVRGAIVAAAPALAARIEAPGYLTPAAAASRLAACTMMLQPYPDGVSGRRGTAMAALMLGVPLVTTSGRFTEPVWAENAAAALAPADGDVGGALTEAAEALLRDDATRQRLQYAGQSLYRDRFALEHTVRALRTAARGASA
jgi:glycosyltransferase involved in cell wall biosynthesis